MGSPPPEEPKKESWVSCPHCASIPAPITTCHVCGGAKRIRLSAALLRRGTVWARANCDCAACRWIGKGPQ